jgi:hypothetical protein
MPWVEFEPTIPASERAKTVYALDRSATVTDYLRQTRYENISYIELAHVIVRWEGLFIAAMGTLDFLTI